VTIAVADTPTLICDLAKEAVAAGYSRYHGSVGLGSHGTPVTEGYDCDGTGLPDDIRGAHATPPHGGGGVRPFVAFSRHRLL